VIQSKRELSPNTCKEVNEGLLIGYSSTKPDRMRQSLTPSYYNIDDLGANAIQAATALPRQLFPIAWAATRNCKEQGAPAKEISAQLVADAHKIY
jgi:hypothetical protein